MTKREFAKRLNEVISKVEALQEELSNIDFYEVKVEVSSIAGDIEENLDSIRSEDLQGEWQDRIDNLTAVEELFDELEELSEKVGEIASALEDLKP